MDIVLKCSLMSYRSLNAIVAQSAHPTIPASSRSCFE